MQQPSGAPPTRPFARISSGAPRTGEPRYEVGGSARHQGTGVRDSQGPQVAARALADSCHECAKHEVVPGGDKPTRPATRFHRPLEDLVATGEALSAWWCPPGCRIIDASAEFRPDGSYSIDVAPVGGGRPFRIEGRYVSIDRQRHLVFTHTFPGQGGHGLQAAYRDAESVVAVSLRPSGAGTAMRLEESALPSEAARELLAGGWPTLLDQLARRLRAGR